MQFQWMWLFFFRCTQLSRDFVLGDDLKKKNLFQNKRKKKILYRSYNSDRGVNSIPRKATIYVYSTKNI